MNRWVNGWMDHRQKMRRKKGFLIFDNIISNKRVTKEKKKKKKRKEKKRKAKLGQRAKGWRSVDQPAFHKLLWEEEFEGL